jgi:Protein of unknown function (DUF3300)
MLIFVWRARPRRRRNNVPQKIIPNGYSRNHTGVKKNSHGRTNNGLVRITLFRVTAIVCAGLLVPGDIPLMAQQAPSSSPADTAARIPPDQLDSLVAPIALYPDPLLAQVLAASTYPLEVVQLEQWLQQHQNLKDQQLADAVQKENWDPSIQSMAALPDVVKQMADNVSWTSELGNAFLAQQSDVMDAVQRMRAKAQANGKLQSGDQIKVNTETVGSQSVVVIEQANPQVVYVPSYDPTVVWGAPPVYAYPPITYPGYYAAGAALSFGAGIAMGAMWGGGWGYNVGWHGGGNNTINVNNVNNFNRNYVRSGGNQVNVHGGNTWQHNPQHRGAAPYANGATANRFGGTAQGGSLANRQANGRQNIGNGGGTGDRGGVAGNRGGQGIGSANRDAGLAGGIGNRGGAGEQGIGNRGGAGGQGIGSANRSGGAFGGGGGAFGGGGGDRIGNRQVSRGFGGSGAFGAGGSSGASARSSMSRGASSFGGGGGGFRGGGGGRRR